MRERESRHFNDEEYVKMLKFLAHFKKTTNDQLDQEEPKKEDTVVLLEEICDLLKTSKEDK